MFYTCILEIIFYGLRWMLSLVLMEYISSQYPMFSVVSSGKTVGFEMSASKLNICFSIGLFSKLSIEETIVASYVLLKTMWLKFLLIWRFFRLWALIDGVTPPENMLRCMSNNYSLEMFWKGWHSSFNKWIVSYMYIPLGGVSNQLYSGIKLY